MIEYVKHYLVNLRDFTVFAEYFISVTIIYALIILTLIAYNARGLIVQKAVSHCFFLVLVLSCCLMLNDHFIFFTEFNVGHLIYPNTPAFVTKHSFNMSIRNDSLGILSKIIICIFSASYFLVISDSFKEQKLTSFEYLLIILLAVLGLMFVCSSNDFLTAYLSIELSSLAFYILASFRKSSSYSVEAGIKYFTIGAISSSFFLLGVSFIYFVTGSITFKSVLGSWAYEASYFKFFSKYDIYIKTISLDRQAGAAMFELRYHCPIMEDIWQPILQLPEEYIRPLPRYDVENYTERDWEVISYFSPKLAPFMPNYFEFDLRFMEVGIALILFSIFIKLAVAPFHTWSLDVYEGSPTSSTIFFAVISKLSLFILLIRICYITFYEFFNCWGNYSVWVGVSSIIVGSFGGLTQRKLKTLLAYSSTSHMGYCLIALSAYCGPGKAHLLFYMVVYMLSGLCIWSIILLTRRKRKFATDKYSKELGDLVLLRKSNPVLAFFFALLMFSVAGIPPMLGFLAKFGIFFSVVSSGYYLIAIVSILASLVSTFYYIRIVKVLYFENCFVGKLYYPINGFQPTILSFFLFLLIFLFLNPDPFYIAIFSPVSILRFFF